VEAQIFLVQTQGITQMYGSFNVRNVEHRSLTLMPKPKQLKLGTGGLTMAEYMEREALLKDISESVVFTVRGDKPSLEIRGANKVIDRIKSAPTADVVEVVRCKDCKDYKQNPYSPEEDMMCMCWCDWLPTDPDDFCSYGKRKEGAEQ
jgi:hypothetical protein